MWPQCYRRDPDAGPAAPVRASIHRCAGADSAGRGRTKPTAKLELGAELQHSVYDDEYSQRVITAGAVAPAIPDIETRITIIKRTAQYALKKSAGVRFDYAYQRWASDD